MMDSYDATKGRLGVELCVADRIGNLLWSRHSIFSGSGSWIKRERVD